MMFRIVGDADAQLPLRVMTPLARCDLVPSHFRLTRGDTDLHIEIGVSQGEADPDRLSDALRGIVGVRTVVAVV
jgi:hypothetical protein